MQVYSLSIVPKDATPESECWSEFWRKLHEKHGSPRYHVASFNQIGVAFLEGGMSSGKTSVMLSLDLGDCSAVVELSLEALETLVAAGRGAAEARGWR